MLYVKSLSLLLPTVSFVTFKMFPFEIVFEVSKFVLKQNRNFFRLINKLKPGSVKKINTMKAPFKQVTQTFIGINDKL